MYKTKDNQDELPQQWKESIVGPICKKGDTNDCSNYRGISLLSVSYRNSLSTLIPFADEIIGVTSVDLSSFSP
jgi:hypothetical protein